MDTPVPDADWMYRYTVRFLPVRDIRIGYLRSAVDREQSTDAASDRATYIRFYASTIIVLQDIL